MSNYFASARANNESNRANSEARRANEAVDIANENYRQANYHEAQSKKHKRNYNALLAEHTLWKNYVYANAEGNRISSAGNTVAGYTNNLAHELRTLKFDLMHSFWDGSNPEAKIALPFHGLPARYETFKYMTMEHRKYINLRMLCRAEWYDWCMHVEVLAKAQQAVVKALMNPTKANEPLRNRKYLIDLQIETDQYNALREKAMELDKGEAAREAFEAERMEFWGDKIQFYIDTNDRNCPMPSNDLTAKANPHIHFDLHLPAGRLTLKWKMNITTGQPAVCFRKFNASDAQSGHMDWKGKSFYI